MIWEHTFRVVDDEPSGMPDCLLGPGDADECEEWPTSRQGLFDCDDPRLEI